jgi:arginine exporter protein ArgO
MSGVRSQEERDDATIEATYTFLTALICAAVTLCVVWLGVRAVSPGLSRHDVHHLVVCCAGAAFVVRTVLRRSRGRNWRGLRTG